MKHILLILIMFLNFIHSVNPIKGQANSSIHQFKAENIENELLDFNSFKGKKILIVNTASKCGLTPQFKQLQEIFDIYKNNNFVIVGFPSNDFAKQDPGNNKEIDGFCKQNYGVSFVMMAKIHVKGKEIHPIYKWLTSKKENGVMTSKIKWNFQKYLINEEGELVDVVAPWRKPNCRKIVKWITKS